MVFAASAQVARAESRDTHRRILTEGLQRIVDSGTSDAGIVRALLDAVKEATPCPEEAGAGGFCDGVSVECRSCSGVSAAQYASLWSGMSIGPEPRTNFWRLDDVLELIGNEAYVTDNYADWMLDPILWWFDEVSPSHGIAGQSYAGLGHFCPGGCDPVAGFAAGQSCWFASNRFAGNRDFDFTGIGEGTAWDGHGSKVLVEALGAFDFPWSSLDHWLCGLQEELDVSMVRDDYRGTSPGRFYVTAAEEAAMGLFLDGPLSGEPDTGWDADDTKFPPVEYLGRYWYQAFSATRSMRHLGPALHALQDAGQPMHVAGTMGNFHEWWESALVVATREANWDGRWGRSPSCRARGTPPDPTTQDAARCVVGWAQDLVREVQRRAADPAWAVPDLGDPRLRTYLHLVYLVAELVRDGDEAEEIRRAAEDELRRAYPPAYCQTIWDDCPLPTWPYPVPGTATWQGEPMLAHDSRRVVCDGYWEEWISADELPPEWAPHFLSCVEQTGHDPHLWYCRLPVGLVRPSAACAARLELFDAGAYRECGSDCVDTRIAARLTDQANEQIDRHVAAAVALLYLAVTEGLEVPDSDGDLLLDDADVCPTEGTRLGDQDRDGIPDGCDLCPWTPRRDASGVPVRSSAQYNRSPGDETAQDPSVAFDGNRAAGTSDSDGDDLGDACDLCPLTVNGVGQCCVVTSAGTVACDRCSRVASPGLDVVSGCSEDDAGCLAARGRLYLLDGDGDTVGRRCDNCPTLANSDQANCNPREDERAYLLEHGSLEGNVGVGDACDATPCVAACGFEMGWADRQLEPAARVRRERMPGRPCVRDADGHEICPYACYVDEPATMQICPVGFPDPAATPDHDTTAHDLTQRNQRLELVTELRGCGCTTEETWDGRCAERFCSDDGRTDGDRRWFYGTYAEQTVTTPPDPDQPLYSYWRTYAAPSEFGFVSSGRGERYERMDSFENWYRHWSDRWSSATPDLPYRKQEWNFLSDMSDPVKMPDEDGDPATPPPFAELEPRDTSFWYRPVRNSAAGFGGFDSRLYGNSYLSTSSLGGFLFRCDSGEPAGFGRLMDIIGRYMEPYDTRAWASLVKLPGLHRPYVALLDRDCPNCDGFLFEDPGSVVGGLVVANWDQAKQTFAPIVASQPVAGGFDLRRSSIAYAVDGNGIVSRYWLFGGIDAAGSPTAQLWGGRLTHQAGLGDLDDEGRSFALSRIEPGPNAAWPPARSGAVLVARSAGTGGNLPPNVDEGAAAAGDATFGDSPVALLLVGGQGIGGPLGDVWAYDGTWHELTGLTGANGGLAETGAAVVDDALWLFGGREATGPSAGLWRLDLATGVAERMDGAGGPTARTSTVLGYRRATNELLVFGGTRAGAGLNDLWAYAIDTAAWRQVAPACSATGCPVTTGGESLVVSGARDEVTIVADASGPGRDAVAWTLREGTWVATGELQQLPGVADCDRDGMEEAAWGARCGAGDDGFPAYGTLRCDGTTGSLTCRTPAAPGAAVFEGRASGAKAVVADGDRIGLLRERELAWFDLASNGALVPAGGLRLTRPTDDAVVIRGRVLAADRAGLTVYDRTTGAPLAALPTCGKARRVFVDGRRAYVVGLRSILVVDITDASAPVALRDLRFAALPDGTAWAAPSTRCGAFYAAADLLCDVSGVCSWFGRIAGAEQEHRLALNALGRTYLVDFRSGLVPVVSPGLATGPLSAVRLDEHRLYAVEPCGRGTLYVEEDDDWAYAGRHDVPRWVAGTVDAGPFTVHLGSARVTVGTRQ